MLNITIELDNINSEVWQVFGQNESWLSDPNKCRSIQERLSHFNHNHSDNPDHVDDVIKALSRGFSLTKSALEWHEPAVGHNSNIEPNLTHKARGMQWRLVMAYGGFETITKALMNDKNRGLKPQTVTNFTQKCSLAPYAILKSPNPNLSNLDRWLTKPAASTEKEALLNFLNVDGGDLKIIKQWMIESKPISDWAEAAWLAKGLRNASAHGALSASKVNQWGLREGLQTLGNNLGEFVVAGLRKLI